VIETLPTAPPVTAEDLLIERSRVEQQRFRNSLVDEAQRLSPGFDPKGYEAHHILPLNEYGELNGLRSRLAGWGIDLNDASVNGVLLPRSGAVGSGTVHADTQRNDVYERAIRDRLEGATTRERAIEVLGTIKRELRNGTFIPPKE
jgi:A nuclease family of the HNH/ENDO VII superfamily with conserved AHH